MSIDDKHKVRVGELGFPVAEAKEIIILSAMVLLLKLVIMILQEWK